MQNNQTIQTVMNALKTEVNKQLALASDEYSERFDVNSTSVLEIAKNTIENLQYSDSTPIESDIALKSLLGTLEKLLAGQKDSRANDIQIAFNITNGDGTIGVDQIVRPFDPDMSEEQFIFGLQSGEYVTSLDVTTGVAGCITDRQGNPVAQIISQEIAGDIDPLSLR